MYTTYHDFINENKSLNCPVIKLTDDIINYVKKFDSDEKLLRSGGLPTDILDKAAFGFSESDITTLEPKQLHIKWKDDLENVKYEIELLNKKSNESLQTTMKKWASKVSLEEPIEVSYEKNKFYIEDGHHRYYAAKILNKPLNVTLEINMNPIKELAPKLSYDDFHRCIFKLVHSINESTMICEEREQFTTLYHGTDVKSAQCIKKKGIDISKSEGGYFGWGFYTTPDFKLAKSNYADASGDDDGGVILELQLSKKANILDLRDSDDFETWKKYARRTHDKYLYLTLVKDGIDGLYDNSFEGVVIYNSKVLKLVKIYE